MGDTEISPAGVIGLAVTIYDDDRSGSFSKPGDMLWERFFVPTDVSVVAPAGSGEQGWLDPFRGEAVPADHHLYGQVNIENIADPFVQEAGTIYWLGVSVTVVEASGVKVGGRRL